MSCISASDLDVPISQMMVVTQLGVNKHEEHTSRCLERHDYVPGLNVLYLRSGICDLRRHGLTEAVLGNWEDGRVNK